MKWSAQVAFPQGHRLQIPCQSQPGEVTTCSQLCQYISKSSFSAAYSCLQLNKIFCLQHFSRQSKLWVQRACWIFLGLDFWDLLWRTILIDEGNVAGQHCRGCPRSGSRRELGKINYSSDALGDFHHIAALRAQDWPMMLKSTIMATIGLW